MAMGVWQRVNDIRKDEAKLVYRSKETILAASFVREKKLAANFLSTVISTPAAGDGCLPIDSIREK